MPWIPPTFWKEKNIWARALIPASLLYGRIQKTLYDSGSPYRSRLPVICIGNVQMGGSGKTPVTQALCRLLIERGVARNPAILLRGYGGELKGPSLVDIGRHSAREVGDEALMHAHYVPTIVSRNRASGARLAEAGGYDMIVMDDGMQNNQLAKTLSYLVFNTDQGTGNNLTFPAGPLREPLSCATARADGIFKIGGDLPFDTNLPVHDCRLTAPTASDPNKPYVAFCGIGDPDKFYKTLASHHYRVVGTASFADHQPYTPRMLADLEDQAAAANATLITTEKDAMRLPPDWQEKAEVLKIAYQIDRADELAAQIRQAIGP